MRPRPIAFFTNRKSETCLKLVHGVSTFQKQNSLRDFFRIRSFHLTNYFKAPDLSISNNPLGSILISFHLILSPFVTMVEINQTKCELAFHVTYNPVYRLSQFYTFTVSFIAAPALFYLIKKRIISLPFHGNLKTLLIVYFISVFIYATVLCFAFGYHVISPFFISSACGLIVDKTVFQIGHILTLFSLTSPMIFPIGFTIERFIATGMASRYEYTPTRLGPILATLSLISNIVIFYFIFQNETFDDIFISFLMLPSTSATQFTNYLWSLFGIKVVNIICNLILIIVHSVLKPKYQKSSLSTKYAMEEITQSSKFTFIITFTHLLFFGVYTICSILVRVLGQSFFGSLINFYVARGINCAVPTYNLVIVIVGFYSLHHLNSRRSKEVTSNIRIMAVGQQGAKNYDDAITSQWATITRGSV
ncbi:hypothetical protein CRE_11912 [Caenorhabditis remanei]|uniref:Uncharacterized protein n=1 Tax=Caenorhabditis remanei TaxID=31234 RepID=E3M4G1_CAERE|nr:hypothetical protein CRE_11912 [Caenorhabditis remanei]